MTEALLRSRRIISFEHDGGLGIDLGLLEGDVLPERDLGPDHDAVAVGGALHALVVRVVGEADEVGVESLR